MRSAKKWAAVPALALTGGVLSAAPATADTVGSTEAAQIAVDEYGGCTINVESEDDGAQWEVELKNTTVDNDANGRIEVNVDAETGEIVSYEDEDSDDGTCDPSLPSAGGGENDGGVELPGFLEDIDFFGSFEALAGLLG